MADRKEPNELTIEALEDHTTSDLEFMDEDGDEYTHDYDLRGMTATRYEHTTYEAEPYLGTVGWYKFTKGKGKKTVRATREDDGAYECLYLRKITKVVKDNGEVELNEFPINIPVGMIPVMNLAMTKISELRDESTLAGKTCVAAK
jgi:hypothetical protein